MRDEFTQNSAQQDFTPVCHRELTICSAITHLLPQDSERGMPFSSTLHQPSDDFISLTDIQKLHIPLQMLSWFSKDLLQWC